MSFASLLHLAPLIDTLNRLDAAIADPSNVTTEQLESDLSAVWGFYGTTDFETVLMDLYGIENALADRDFDIAFNSAFQMMFHFESEYDQIRILKKRFVLGWIPYFWDSWQQVERELTRLKSNREGV
jgi:hypothetical protein